MKPIVVLAAILALAAPTITSAQTSKSHHGHKVTHHKSKKKYPRKPKNEITKLEKARADDHATRQVTPDPHKSPGKHADNLSKNVNHELNRESKDINHFFQGKKKK